MHNNNTIEESSYELEETLSLCDLPLYSDQSADCSLASNSLSSSSCQEDYFEFFTNKLSAAIPPPENIIFCGKLIPFKQTCEEIKINQTINKRKRYGQQLFKWNWKEAQKRQEVSKKMYNTNKNIVRKGRGKMSVFTASASGKGKWYLLMFGFSPVVELRDIKNRQRSLRRQCSSPSPPPPAMFGSPNHDGKVINNDRGWGLWGLIRALSCFRS